MTSHYNTDLLWRKRAPQISDGLYFTFEAIIHTSRTPHHIQGARFYLQGDEQTANTRFFRTMAVGFHFSHAEFVEQALFYNFEQSP